MPHIIFADRQIFSSEARQVSLEIARSKQFLFRELILISILKTRVDSVGAVGPIAPPPKMNEGEKGAIAPPRKKYYI